MPTSGDTFGRYSLEQSLGHGGMGEVFRAFDTVLKRRVALKVMLDSGAEGSEGRARLLREAQAAAALSHPNAVRVHDAGEIDGVPFIAMELVDGDTLRVRMRRAPEQREVLGWLREVASAIGAAHALGIVHRDVKPDNVMVRPDGRAVVLDFGIARRAATATGVDASAPTAPVDHLASLTEQGAVIGTPVYMAPEQLQGGLVDARSDQFSWGVMAYECLAGELPWGDAKDLLSLGAAIATKSVKSLPDTVPTAVSVAVLRTLEKDPRGRFLSMEDVGHAIDEEARRSVPVSLRADVRSGAPSAPTTAPLVTATRRRYAAPLAAALMTVVASGGWIAWKRVAAPLSATAAKLAGEAPVSADAEAARLYGEGMKVWRTRSASDAEALWHRATAQDPTLAAAHLRLAISTLLGEGDSPAARTWFRQATSHQERFSARDRSLADAVTPLFDVPSDVTGADLRLAALGQATPSDDEIPTWRGILAGTRHDLAAAVARYDEALRRNPDNMLALGGSASALVDLGRPDEAERRARDCVSRHPEESDCQSVLVLALSNDGQCVELEHTIQRWQAADPTSWLPPDRLTLSLALRRADPEAIDEALKHVVLNLKNDNGDQVHWGRFQSARWAGDFVRAEDEGREREKHLLELGTSFESRAANAWSIIELLLESGDLTAAKTLARKTLAVREATPGVSVGYALDSSVLPRLYAILRDERPSEWAKFKQARSAQEVAIRSGPETARVLFWNSQYATRPMTAEDAREAAAEAKVLGIPEKESTDNITFDLGIAVAAAGESSLAARYLTIILGGCQDGPMDPFGWMHARLVLAKLREAGGDKAEARALYQVIIDTWGNAKPRSVTAEEAKRRLARL